MSIYIKTSDVTRSLSGLLAIGSVFRNLLVTPVVFFVLLLFRNLKFIYLYGSFSTNISLPLYNLFRRGISGNDSIIFKLFHYTSSVATPHTLFPSQQTNNAFYGSRACFSQKLRIGSSVTKMGSIKLLNLSSKNCSFERRGAPPLAVAFGIRGTLPSRLFMNVLYTGNLASRLIAANWVNRILICSLFCAFSVNQSALARKNKRSSVRSSLVSFITRPPCWIVVYSFGLLYYGVGKNANGGESVFKSPSIPNLSS